MSCQGVGILSECTVSPPTWEPGPANQNEFFPTKGLHYRPKYSSVSSAVRVACLRPFGRWRSRMWRSWAGLVTPGTYMRLWERLIILPNSLIWRWMRLMVEKLTLNYLVTAVVDIPAVSMPIARSLKTWDICGIVLCNKTAHFRVAFYCPQHKVHLCNDHAASWYATPVRWMDYLGKGEMLTKRGVNKFVHNILEKKAFCAYRTFQGSFLLSHETNTLHVAFLF